MIERFGSTEVAVLNLGFNPRNLGGTFSTVSAQANNRHFRGPAANINNHMPGSRSDWDIRADRRGYWFFDDISGFSPGSNGRVNYCSSLG